MSSEPESIGRYVACVEIGAGATAVVHAGRARGEANEPVVAIKRLRPHLASDPVFSRMLRHEAKLVARVRHPNVVPMLDVVASDGVLALVTEYVAGETLAGLQSAARARGVSVPLPIALAIATNVLDGLHAAHEARDELGAPLSIVHRDVSPQNVIVGVDGVARVLDFGIAKAEASTQLSEVGQAKGKLAYMSPEQLTGDRVLDRSTDVYSASVVLWELVTGRRMYEGLDKPQIAALIRAGAVRSPRSIVPSLPESLVDVLAKGLEVDPSARFETARDMARALEACGPCAPPAEVAAWVEGLAHEALAARRLALASIEMRASSPSRPASVERRRGARGRIAGIAVAAITVAILGLVAERASDAASAAVPSRAARLESTTPRSLDVSRARRASTAPAGAAQAVAVVAHRPPARPVRGEPPPAPAPAPSPRPTDALFDRN